MKLFDSVNNELVDFLVYYGAKRRDRRKYIEYKILNYSIVQEYYGDRNIYIRVKRNKYNKFSGSRYSTKKYEILYSCYGSKQGLKYFKHYLEMNNVYRKLKITKLCGLKI